MSGSRAASICVPISVPISVAIVVSMSVAMRMLVLPVSVLLVLLAAAALLAFTLLFQLLKSLGVLHELFVGGLLLLPDGEERIFAHFGGQVAHGVGVLADGLEA